MKPTVKPLSADPICGFSSVGRLEGTEEEVETTSSEFFSKMTSQARSSLEAQAKDWTDDVLRRLRSYRERGGSLRRASDDLRLAADQLDLCIDLIQDMRTGRYTGVSWPTALMISGAVLYAVSPADFIPDAIVGLGVLDDAMILMGATRLARRELKKYCDARGIDSSRYFPDTDRKTSNDLH